MLPRVGGEKVYRACENPVVAPFRAESKPKIAYINHFYKLHHQTIYSIPIRVELRLYI